MVKGLPHIPWVWAWGAVALAFPWSNALMSMATGLLGFSALLHIFGNRSAYSAGRPMVRNCGWGLILLVAWSGMSWFWGGDIDACLHDVRVKLPLAIGGMAMIAMSRENEPIPESGVDALLRLAVASAASATVAVVVLDIFDGGEMGGRQASRFISHIRFGLWWALLLPWVTHRLGAKWQWLALGGALLAWTWLQGVTGMAVGCALAPWWWPSVQLGRRASDKKAWPSRATIRRAGIRFGAVGMVLLMGLVSSLPTAPPNAESLPLASASGEKYIHKLDRCVTENGHHVWTMIAWSELNAAWQQRSDVPIENIQGALIRFLASKGLSKDTEGVAQLSVDEVRAIETGIPSVVELEGTSWARRWNRFAYNWGEWWDGRRSPDASILSRSVYLEVGVAALGDFSIKDAVLGSGIGGLIPLLESNYEEHVPDWPKEGRKRPHNQFLTLLLSLGVVGLAIWCWALVSTWPCHPSRPAVLLLALSCLAEDTLETQAGVTLTIVALAWGLLIPFEGRE